MFLIKPSRIMAVKPRLGTVKTTSARPSFSHIQRSLPVAKQYTICTAIATSRLNSLLLKTSCSVSKSTKTSVKYQCPKCDFQAQDKNDMKNHVVEIHKSKPFVCFHCEETFSNFKVMQSHVKALHPEVGVIKEPYALVSEKENTKLKGSSKTTTLSTKGTKPAPSGQGTLPQEINAVQSSPTLFKSAAKTSDAANKSVSKSAEISVMYQCPKCDFQAEDKNDMKNHVVEIHKSKPFVCFHCEETFSNFKVMQSHIKARHPEVGVVKEPYALVSGMENIKLKGSSKTSPPLQESVVQSSNKARDITLDQNELKPKGKKTKTELGIKESKGSVQAAELTANYQTKKNQELESEIEPMLKIIKNKPKEKEHQLLREKWLLEGTKSKDNKLNIDEHLKVKEIKDKVGIKCEQSKIGHILAQQINFEVPQCDQKVKRIGNEEILLDKRISDPSTEHIDTSTVTKSLKKEEIGNVELTSIMEHSQKEEQPHYVLKSRLDKENRAKLLKAEKEAEDLLIVQQMAYAQKWKEGRKEKEEQLLKDQKEEQRLLKEQEEQRLLEAQKEQEEKLLKEQKEKEHRLLKEQKEKEQWLLEEQKAKEEKLLKEKKELLLNEQKEEQLLKKQKEEQRLLKKKTEKERLLEDQKEKEQLLKKQKEEQRLLKDQEEQRLLEAQKEKEEKLIKEQKEKEHRLLREQKEKERLLEEPKAKEEQLLKEKEELLLKELNEELLLKKQKEEQRLLKEQKEKERLLEEQKEKEQLLKKQREDQRLLEEQREKEQLLLKEKEEHPQQCEKTDTKLSKPEMPTDVKSIKIAFQQDIKKEINTDLQENKPGLLNWFKSFISRK